MKNLPHILKGLYAAPMGPKMKMKMSQGITLSSVVGNFILSKFTQSKLTTVTQMTLPRNVFLKFLNPRQHGNSDCKGNLKIKTYLFPVYDSQEFCQSAEWQTSMAPSHHTNLFL